MGTDIRPEVSQRNPYWIEKHRYYELKHFCMQYPLWKKSYRALDGYGQSSKYVIRAVSERFDADPTMACAQALTYYANRIGMIDRAAHDASSVLAEYIVRGVTEGVSYDILRARHAIPCCRDEYYGAYRKFFWILDRIRN